MNNRLKSQNLTLKQSKFVYHYLTNGGNGRRAVISAGYNVKDEKSADALVQQNLNNPSIQAKITQAMAKLNITEDKIAEVIADGLNAEMVFYNPITKQPEETGIKNHTIRHKFLETVLDIVGAKAPTKSESTINLRGVLAVGDIDKIRQRVGI